MGGRLLSADELDELRLLRDSAAKFADLQAGNARLRARRDLAVEFDPEVWAKMADAGFLATAIPTEFGGWNLPLDHRAAIAEEFGRALLPEPYSASAQFAATTIVRGDNPELMRKLLPDIASGKLVAAVAWEDGPNSIVDRSVAATAQMRGDRIVLNGRQRFVRPGAMIDGLIVAATSAGGVGMYWLPAFTEGLSMSPQRLADGGHVVDISMQNVELTRDSTVQSAPGGEAVLSGAIDEALVMASAELLGISRKALQMTLDYLRTREQFGKPIGSFQALQHRAVDLYIQQELSQASIDSALAEFRGDAGPARRGMAASRAKARCCDTANRITREAVQMHGAIGFTDEYDVGLYLKRAVVQSAWLGNAAQHRRRYLILRRSCEEHSIA